LNDLGPRLSYRYDARPQTGCDIDHTLFELLSAVDAHGSIRHAAKSMGASYRHVWGALKDWEQRLDQPLVDWMQGKRATLTVHAHRLLWGERLARARMAAEIDNLRADLRQVMVQSLDGPVQVLAVAAPHDPFIADLRALLADERVHLRQQAMGSLDALRSLSVGACTVAGWHIEIRGDEPAPAGTVLRSLLRSTQHRLVGVLQRQLGLMSRPEVVVPSLRRLPEAVADGLRYLHRQPGSGTRVAIEQLMAAEGLKPAAISALGAQWECSHLAAATALAAGLGDIAPGTAWAAQACGLGFLPLVDDHYLFACNKDDLEQPAVKALRDALHAPAWLGALEALPGHVPWQSGEAVGWSRAMPWWNFRPRPQSSTEPATTGA